MDASRDLPRHVFGVLCIGAFSFLSLWILKPFLPATLWAATIAVATWPLLLALQRRLWNRRWPAALVMTGALLFVFLVPFMLAVGALATNAEAIAAWTRSLTTLDLPPLPDWVEKLPRVGGRVAAAWRDLAETGGAGLLADLRPYAGTLAHGFAASVGNLGGLLVQFLLTVVATGIFYVTGEAAAAQVGRFGRRLAGAQGEAAVHLAGQAIRGVALGVVVTAFVQAALAGLGLLVAGVPFAAVLTAVMFMLSLAQLGPLLVLIPAVAWLYWKGASGWATFLAVWTIVVAPLDNLLRPVLIKRGVDLPFLLVFAGVVGGLLAFGLVGIFIGPVVLAVSFTLLSAWVETGLAPPPEEAAASARAD
jgi:predicted PurR-regulated permease PerM